jgi:predicted transcriptional regulator
MSPDSDTEKLENIIQDFPFRRQKSQKEKLARFLISEIGLSKLDTQKETGISQPTIRQIQESYNQLDEESKLILIEKLVEYYRNNLLKTKY